MGWGEAEALAAAHMYDSTRVPFTDLSLVANAQSLWLPDAWSRKEYAVVNMRRIVMRGLD